MVTAKPDRKGGLADVEGKVGPSWQRTKGQGPPVASRNRIIAAYSLSGSVIDST